MQKKILFIHTNYSSFVRTDFDILSQYHQVTKYQYKPVKGVLKNISEIFRQFFFLLFNMWRFDAAFIWFADYHSFLPVLFAKIFRKKSFTVIGGYDVARMPSLNYGVFLSKIRGFCAIFTMNYSTVNLTVSKYVDRKVRWIAQKASTRLIYNCVNISNRSNQLNSKENLITTVGLINSEKSFILKGIDTFIKTAEYLPEYNFLIIGVSQDYAKNSMGSLPENVNITGFINHEELHSFYQKAKIYCQFSRSEAFGVAVIESMSFGCVPFVTKEGGLPEVIGNYGFLVKRDPKSIAEMIRKQQTISGQVSDFQNWITDNFSLEKRLYKIIELIDHNI